MEKFGIFELLDALAALTESVPAEPKTDDPAFSAPSYGTDLTPADTARTADGIAAARTAAGMDTARTADGTDTRGEGVRPHNDALGDLLARHDRITKKAKK